MKLNVVQAGLRAVNTLLLVLTVSLIACGVDHCTVKTENGDQECERLSITQWSVHEGLYGQFLVVVGLLILTGFSIVSIVVAFHNKKILNQLVIFFNVIESFATVAVFCAELYYATCPWEDLPSSAAVANRTGYVCIVRSWAVASFSALMLTVLSVVDMVVHWRRMAEQQAVKRRNRTRKLTFDERLELDKEHFMEFSRKVSTRLPLTMDLPSTSKLTEDKADGRN